MSKTNTTSLATALTTEGGAPVADDANSQTAGPQGPTLLQDHHLLEKLARFNRERIPERVVHAVGSGAYGEFVVTHDITTYTRAALFSAVGKKTKTFLRFSTVAGSKGAADTVRDPRGFALKFYSEDGNFDIVGNNTPIFFLRDGIKFPDFIHSQKYDPFTNRQEPNNAWDFFSHTPEATHQFIWLHGDRGIPATLRHTDGFGSHTFSLSNKDGERYWVKFHFKTNQGIKSLTSEQATLIAGKDPAFHQKDLYDAIERKEFPSWTLKIQVMPEKDASTYRFNPFDVTKVWPYQDYPLITVGTLTLNAVPDNYFAATEQSAFDPGNFVDGIGPSPDRMLQARLFAYGDAHRYRLGTNHTRIPVNAPQGVRDGARNYGRDGAMRFDDNGGRGPNYAPNSRGGPAPTSTTTEGFTVSGDGRAQPQPLHKEDSDFVQAGMLYRVMKADEQARLVDNLAGGLAQVTLPGVVDRSISYFAAADRDLGVRLTAAVKAKKVQK